MYPKQIEITAVDLVEFVQQLVGDGDSIQNGELRDALNLFGDCVVALSHHARWGTGSTDMLYESENLQRRERGDRSAKLRFSYDKDFRPFVPFGNGHTQENGRRMLDQRLELLSIIQATMERFFLDRGRQGGRCWLHAVESMRWGRAANKKQ